MRTRRVMVMVCVGLAATLPVAGGGQVVQQRIQSEVRLDAIFARSSGVEAAYGFTVPVGIYVRSGIVAGVGVGRHGAEGRTDFVSRFSFDPFRQTRWAPYAGAGLSGRYRSELDGGARAYLLVYLGVEGPLPLGELSAWVPALEVGLGGGARVGLILRRGVNARR
ncbi:MAG: hypothetical protein ABI994_03380 [Gemmatimonadales bacterium]